jgi:hypothetical protein
MFCKKHLIPLAHFHKHIMPHHSENNPRYLNLANEKVIARFCKESYLVDIFVLSHMNRFSSNETYNQCWPQLPVLEYYSRVLLAEYSNRPISLGTRVLEYIPITTRLPRDNITCSCQGAIIRVFLPLFLLTHAIIVLLSAIVLSILVLNSSIVSILLSISSISSISSTSSALLILPSK